MGPGGPGGPGGPPPPQSAQPLPSNVLGKGGDRSLDQQYMQQSSQIFVFSTEWANRGAQSVMENQSPSIIHWHESQQETKKQLEDMAKTYPQMKQVMHQQQHMRFSQMNKMMKGPKGQ